MIVNMNVNNLCLYVDNRISVLLKDIPREFFIKITKALTFPNPEYLSAVKYGYSKWGKPSEIKLYKIDQDWLHLPRGFGSELIRLLKKNNIDYQIKDSRLLLSPVDFGSKIKLWNYQVPAVKKMIRHRQGGIVAGCGAGKTQIMLEVMAHIKQPALWVCHTHELLQQTRERVVENLMLKPEEIGIIASGDVKLGEKLTISLIQTLNRLDLKKISNSFGAIFIDEAHHLAARTFFNTINKFPALYRFWASATPDRADGLTKIIYACGGPALYQIDRSELSTVTPELKVIETDFNSYEINYARLISKLIQNKKRNQLIVQAILREAPGNYSLVLSERIKHLSILKNMLNQAMPDLQVEILTGKIPKKTRERIMSDVNAGKVDVLLATQLAREGLDIEHLNRLFLATPKRGTGALEQEIGRIMRPSENKDDAVVYDFWDVQNPILKSQFWSRRETYRKLGIYFNPRYVEKSNMLA